MLSRLPLFLLLAAGMEAKEVHSPHVEPYLGSYQVEDSCQFSVCGPEYSQEFGVGRTPEPGSCSGECDQLAVSLITNRFSREFLWSSCTNMCNDKYSQALFSDYKTRLSCVSSCFSLYAPLAPHHNLARYCIQASCPQHESLPQLDCFSQCSSHVSSRVSVRDWEEWAGHLTTTCQEDHGQGRYHRLECADDAVWNSTISKVSHQEIETISEHCRGEICSDSLDCANICLEHLLEVARDKDRVTVWQTCTTSHHCQPTCQPVSACSAERLTCADQCLERTLAARRQRLTEERSASEQLAILASRAGLPSLTVSLLLVTSLAISFTSL